MRCALVLYLVVATIFVVACSLPELCEIRGYGEKTAYCGRHDVKYTLDFIPPVSQNISHIDLRGQPLKQLPYNAFRNVSSQSSISAISLQHCQISHVDAGALLNLHNLTLIDLTHNQINHIDSQLFSDTRQIKRIYLDFNEIEVVPSGLFQNLTQLEVVYLEYNRIRQVERFSFANTPSLRTIDLDDNQIESMNMSFKDKFDSLTYLWLDGNPWKCNCELGPLYELLVRINQLDQYGLDYDKPPTLHGRYWSDISRDKFVCRAEDATSSQDSVMTGTAPRTTTEQDDTIPVTVHNGTRDQPVDTGVPQPPPHQNWIPYTILILVLVCVAAVIIGVVLLKRRSFQRTNARNVDSGLPMLVVQSSAVSEDSDSASNMADVDEKSTNTESCYCFGRSRILKKYAESAE